MIWTWSWICAMARQAKIMAHACWPCTKQMLAQNWWLEHELFNFVLVYQARSEPVHDLKQSRPSNYDFDDFYISTTNASNDFSRIDYFRVQKRRKWDRRGVKKKHGKCSNPIKAYFTTDENLYSPINHHADSFLWIQQISTTIKRKFKNTQRRRSCPKILWH